jgi:hypothetical protein
MVVPDARRRRRMRGLLWPCAERSLSRRRTAGHLWPCAERCRAEAADRGPSVALCGKMLGPKRRTAGHLWPADGRLRKRLEMRCDHVSGGPLPRPGRLTCPLAVRRGSCELVNLRERCATRCTQQERPTRTRATKCCGRPRTAHASLRAAGASAHRRPESSTARPVTRPRRGRPAPAG